MDGPVKVASRWKMTLAEQEFGGELKKACCLADFARFIPNNQLWNHGNEASSYSNPRVKVVLCIEKILKNSPTVGIFCPCNTGLDRTHVKNL